MTRLVLEGVGVPGKHDDVVDITGNTALGADKAKGRP